MTAVLEGVDRNSVPATSLCAYSECRQPLARKWNEGNWRFVRRKYCDTTCQAAGRRTPPQAKPCETCGGPIVRKHMNKGEWAKRRWCSNDCRFAGSRSAATSKVCELCGATYFRGERAATDFNAQKYCTKECGFTARRNEDPPAEAGPYVSYDIDEAPPCFLDAEFFKEEERIQASLRNVAGPHRAAKLGPAMDNVRNLWCLDCPLMQQCAEWAKGDSHTGIAGGEWYIEGEKQ